MARPADCYKVKFYPNMDAWDIYERAMFPAPAFEELMKRLNVEAASRKKTLRIVDRFKVAMIETIGKIWANVA